MERLSYVRLLISERDIPKANSKIVVAQITNEPARFRLLLKVSSVSCSFGFKLIFEFRILLRKYGSYLAFQIRLQRTAP